MIAKYQNIFIATPASYLFALWIGFCPQLNAQERPESRNPRDQSIQTRAISDGERDLTDAKQQADTERQADAEIQLEKLSSRYLPNPILLHPKVISGGLPDGDPAFEELARLGVKTVISVDGAKPDVATAKKFGLRYVHLPHGYDGISDARAMELAKAVHELEGPIYIHCHHGKHRSPAAATVACVRAGLLPPAQALAVLNLAGTGKNYRGLYRCAQDARAVEKERIERLRVDFQEIVEVPPMAEAMVELAHVHEHLNEVEQAGWSTPLEHPDLEPAHQALLIREQFTELLRTDEAASYPEDFQELLRDSEAAAIELERLLEQWVASESRGAPPPDASKSAARIAANCKTCHIKYRDN